MKTRVLRLLAATFLLTASKPCFAQMDEGEGVPDVALQAASANDGTFRAEKDISYVKGGDAMQKLDVYAPIGATKLPVVLWIHGGGWGAGDKSNVTFKGKAFSHSGLVLVPINYRLRPKFKLEDMMQDAAKAVSWVRKNITAYGGDPDRIFITGHSAGGQMSALLCTDDRFLKAEGVPFTVIRGCMPMDANTYDVPALYRVLDADKEKGKEPKWSKGVRAFFGDDRDYLHRYSAVTYVKSGKNIPPFLLIHAAKSAYTVEQAKELCKMLNDIGTVATTHAVPKVSHSQLAANIGKPGDESTRVLFEFIHAQAEKAKTK